MKTIYLFADDYNCPNVNYPFAANENELKQNLIDYISKEWDADVKDIRIDIENQRIHFKKFDRWAMPESDKEDLDCWDEKEFRLFTFKNKLL